MRVIKDMLAQCMAYQPSKEVRGCAVRACVSFLCDNEGDTATIRQFNDLLPVLLQVVAEFVDNDDDSSVFQCLVDLASTLPKPCDRLSRLKPSSATFSWPERHSRPSILQVCSPRTTPRPIPPRSTAPQHPAATSRGGASAASAVPGLVTGPSDAFVVMPDEAQGRP